jgi:outer membrane receptor protein involved in Fe transport
MLLSLNAPALVGQTSATGALTVIVRDPSGGVIPGASLTLANSAGVSRTQVTNADGTYTFPLLPPGDYHVSISATGFRPLDVPSVTVHVTETETLAESLQVGDQAQQVEVTGQADSLQTETSSLGQVVNTRSLSGLPLVTRNYTQILNLSPGVTSDVTNASQVGRGFQNIFVNGQDNTANAFQMDGVLISNYASSQPADATGFYGNIPIPSPDALQEFKVQTSLYDSSYGRNSGANVNVITKSGSDQFHGSLFEFLRNDLLNANTFFQNETGQPRGELKQNQFGGTIGGPIKKDKLFFFFSYQGTRQVNGVAPAASSTVTLPEQLTNDRSLLGLENAFCAGNPNNAAGGAGAPYAKTFGGGQQITCPGGGAPGAGTVPIPVNTPGGLSSVALALLNAKLPSGGFVIPTPQTIVHTASGSVVGLSSFSEPATFNENQELMNVDYNISSKNLLALRYYYSIGTLVSPFTVVGQPPNGGNRGLSGDQLFSAKLTTLLTPNLVNEVRGSIYYIRASLDSLVTTTTSQLGITPSNPTSTLVPTVAITGLFSNFGTTIDGTKTPQLIYEWADQISWSHGSHTIRAGYDQQHVNWDICSCGKIRGGLTFQSFADFLLGESAAQNGSPYSNVFTSTASIQLMSSPNQLRENSGALFVQDDWKATKRLTLNLGLRWEYDGSAYDALGVGGTNAVWGLDQTVPIPPAGGTFVGYTVKSGFTGTVPPGVIQRSTQVLTSGGAPLHNFSPRVGFAWQPLPSNKLVVRGGYGWFYDVAFGNAWLQTLNTTPPNAALLSYSGVQNGAATFAVPFNPPVAPGSFTNFVRTTTSAISQHGVDPNLVTPYSMNWNINIQYAITPTLTMEVGYVGDRGLHLLAPQLYDIPQLASAGNPVNCGYPSGCITTNTAANAALRLPVLGFSVAGVQIASNIGDSNYESLQAILKKNFSHGLQFGIAYTYGRSFSDLVGASIPGGVGLSTNSNDPSNRAQQYGPSDYNRPQRLVINYNYAFPKYHTDKGFVGKALSGWGLSGVTTIQSGLPITFTDTRGGAVYGFAGASRAQLCPGATYGDIATNGSTEQRLNGYFNASAFCGVPIVGAVNGVGGATGFGDTGRGILLGPGQDNWDFAVLKRTEVGGLNEHAYLEFRSEFFNTFNHPQFTNPASNVASPSTFGVITTTSVGPRIIQFALRYAF